MKKYFNCAKPVWLKGYEKEIHIRMQAKSQLNLSNVKNTVVNIATSGIYHLYVNGTFVCYGPARAGKGYFRVDEIDITKYLKKGDNTVVVEVCGYYAYSYYLQKQPSFLASEIIEDGVPIAWTGEHFTARFNPHYVRKVQRYSFQRPMIEAYRVINNDTFLTDTQKGDFELEVTDESNFIERIAPYPIYEKIPAEAVSGGSVSFIEPERFFRDRSCTTVNPHNLCGFPLDELEFCVTDECQKMQFSAPDMNVDGNLSENTYAIYKLSHNSSGMLSFSVDAQTDLSLYVIFDEILNGASTVDYMRGGCANIVRYDLKKGKNKLQFFDVYTMKYIQFVAVNGSCTVSDIEMIEYKHPPIELEAKPKDEVIDRITKAALETFLQNNVDVCTDCPSRERAGWLCDSFFSGRTEYALTGENPVEKSFLENFLHADKYDGLPDGMLPMCYPADHLNCQFLPNWVMFLILELEEHLERTSDRELIDRFQNKVNGILNYFEKFENEDGLLEKLESWVFIEWSKANEFVQDVNYPTNMLYSAALAAASRLYGNKEYYDKSEKLKAEILKQSFNGKFFIDNAIREDGVLKQTNNITEVCQYYAFFFGIADKDTHKELLNTLINDFGPSRDTVAVWPEVHLANAFIGNFLRLDILMQLGLYEKVLENIIGYFDYMAVRTGTLWENITPNASCNHGFGGYVLSWILKLYKAGYIG